MFLVFENDKKIDNRAETLVFASKTWFLRVLIPPQTLFSIIWGRCFLLFLVDFLWGSNLESQGGKILAAWGPRKSRNAGNNHEIVARGGKAGEKNGI